MSLDVRVAPSLPFDCYPSALLTFLPLQDFFQLLRNRVEGLRRTGSGASYELASIFDQLFRLKIEDMVPFQNHSNEISKEAPLNVLTNQTLVGPDDRSRIENIIKSNYLNNSKLHNDNLPVLLSNIRPPIPVGQIRPCPDSQTIQKPNVIF